MLKLNLKKSELKETVTKGFLLEVLDYNNRILEKQLEEKLEQKLEQKFDKKLESFGKEIAKQFNISAGMLLEEFNSRLKIVCVEGNDFKFKQINKTYKKHADWLSNHEDRILKIESRSKDTF